MTFLREATDLRHLQILCCLEMECVFSAGYPQINNLSTLSLEGLFKLTAVCSPCPSTCMLSSLARIYIIGCHRLKELFSFDCLPPNLEEIDVCDCNRMKEIVTWEEGSRIASGSSDTTQTQLLCLPKLKKLVLLNLPGLKSIFPENRITIASDALKKIEVNNCPLLRGCLCIFPYSQTTNHPLHLIFWNSGYSRLNGGILQTGAIPMPSYTDPKQQWEYWPVKQDILDAPPQP